MSSPLLLKARRVASLFASNAVGTVLGQVVQLVAIPAQLHYLGAAQFGLLVLFNSFVMAGALTDAGIGPTVLRFVGRTERHPKALEHVIASSLTAILILSAVVSALGIGLGWAYGTQNGGVRIADSATPILLAVFIVSAIAASMVVGLGLNILRGLRQYRAFSLCESAHRIFLPLLSTAAAVIWRDASAVLLVNVIWTLLAAIGILIYATRKVGVPLHLTNNLRYFKRRMFSFSRWVWVQSAFAYGGSQADRFIVAGFMDLQALAPYSIAMSVANSLLAVLAAGGGFLLPEATSRLNDRAWLARSFVQYTTLFSAISAASILLFIPMSPYLLNVWLGASHGVKVLPILLAVLWIISNASSSTPGSQLLNAMGHSKFAAFAGAAANGFILLAMLLGGHLWGLWGIVGARMLSIPFGFCIRALTAQRIFNIPRPLWVAIKMVWPTLAGTLIVFPLSWYLLVR